MEKIINLQIKIINGLIGCITSLFGLMLCWLVIVMPLPFLILNALIFALGLWLFFNCVLMTYYVVTDKY
jgi:hypothetical protein